MADTNFKTTEEMFAAGYAIPIYSILSDSHTWKFRDETFKTFSCPTVRNSEPDIPLARIEDVRERAIGR